MIINIPDDIIDKAYEMISDTTSDAIIKLKLPKDKIISEAFTHAIRSGRLVDCLVISFPRNPKKLILD